MVKEKQQVKAFHRLSPSEASIRFFVGPSASDIEDVRDPRKDAERPDHQVSLASKVGHGNADESGIYNGRGEVVGRISVPEIPVPATSSSTDYHRDVLELMRKVLDNIQQDQLGCEEDEIDIEDLPKRRKDAKRPDRQVSLASKVGHANAEENGHDGHGEVVGSVTVKELAVLATSSSNDNVMEFIRKVHVMMKQDLSKTFNEKMKELEQDVIGHCSVVAQLGKLKSFFQTYRKFIRKLRE